MSLEFSDKTFVVLGKLKSMTKDEAWLRIKELGGWTSKTPRPSSDYIIMGQKVTEKKLAQAKAVGKPIITEEDFLEALAAAEGGKSEDSNETDSPDAIPALQELLAEPPSSETWDSLVAQLDACPKDQLEAAVQLSEQHVQNWPIGATGIEAPWPVGKSYELRQASHSWTAALLQGEQSPKYQLVRSMDLSPHKVNGALATRLLENPTLDNLRELDLGKENKLSATFHKKLRLTEMLPNLETLTFRYMNEKVAASLCGEHQLNQLRFVTLAAPGINADAEEFTTIYNKLFEAEWWEQIEGLNLQISKSVYNWTYANAYTGLAAHIHRMPNLKHLILSDSEGLEPLFEGKVFHSLERLSFGAMEEKVGLNIIHYLNTNVDHTVRVLDVSCSVLFYENARKRHNAWLKALLKVKHPGMWQEIVLCENAPTAKLRESLDVWAEELGVTITHCPWRLR